MIRFTQVLAVAVLIFGNACDKKSADGSGNSKGGGPVATTIAAKDGAAGLEAYFVAARAACDAKDVAKGKGIVLGLIPDPATLKKVLRDDAPAGFVDKVIEQYKKLPPDDDRVMCLISPPNRTEIKVHTAKTEEIAAHAQGTPGGDEFPGGAQKVAQQALRPGVTFYEVETLEPGKDSGTRFHLFFWDGTTWKMMGAAWRAVEAAPPQ